MKLTRTLFPVIGGALLAASLTTSMTAAAVEDPALTVSDKDRLRHESTGIIGGAVIGGIIGGPFGAVLTAAFGGWVSEQTLAKKENTLLTDALDNRRQELVALQAEYRAMEARYQVASREAESARLRNASFEAQTAPAVSCCTDSALSLHFKTNSVAIEPLYNDELTQFAKLVRDLPEAVIEITGHADRRGDSSANLALSQRRVQAVEQKLQALGVRTSSLQTSAFGESRPASDTDTMENNFFDRRVVLRVVSAENGYLTRAND